MENASKALIIAGAILISILLISVGILVMNSTNGMQGEMASKMDEMQKQSFNADFTTYGGTNKTASDVSSLFSKVNASNASHDESTKVTLNINGEEATADVITDLSTRVRYRIVVRIDTTGTGLVNVIDVTPMSGGTSTPPASI